MKVPYYDLESQNKQCRKELDFAIGRVLDGGVYCLGPEVNMFEKEFAEFIGVPHCIAVNSGTSALHLAMLLLKIGPGDEVILPALSFVATAWAVSYVGAKPVFVDVEADTMNIDPAEVLKAVTPKTKAVIAVHLYGQPCNLKTLLPICDSYGIPLVEDACQAHGATYAGKKVGSFGVMSAFSFYPGKNLGACGEGGALVTSHPDFAIRARSLREHGSAQRYYHDEVGYNYRMDAIQGAILRVKLQVLSRWNIQRFAVAVLYCNGLTNSPVRLQEFTCGIGAWHLFVVRHPRARELRAFLEAREIGTALHYPVPIHLQKAYAHLGYKPGSMPVAEATCEQCLSLPIWPGMSDAQIKFVIDSVLEFFA